MIFLKKLFVEEKDSYITKPKFLDMEVVAVPFAALKATRKGLFIYMIMQVKF